MSDADCTSGREPRSVAASIQLYSPLLVEKRNIWRKKIKLEMWVNAQCDGRPAELRWRPSIQRREVWLQPTTTCRVVTLPRRETS